MVNSLGRLPDVLFPKWSTPKIALKRQHLVPLQQAPCSLRTGQLLMLAKAAVACIEHYVT